MAGNHHRYPVKCKWCPLEGWIPELMEREEPLLAHKENCSSVEYWDPKLDLTDFFLSYVSSIVPLKAPS